MSCDSPSWPSTSAPRWRPRYSAWVAPGASSAGSRAGHPARPQRSEGLRPGPVLLQEVAKLPLRIRVQPGAQRMRAAVAVLYYAPGGLEVSIQRVEAQPPTPLPFPVEVQLPPGDYTVLAARRAEKSASRARCIDHRPSSCRSITRGACCSNPSAWTRGAIRSRLQTCPLRACSRRPSSSPLKIPPPSSCASDPDRQVHTGFGRVSMDDPSAGIYRARLVLPEGPLQEQTLEVHKGGRGNWILKAPPLPMGQMQRTMLHALSLPMDSRGYVSPSVEHGPVAHLRLASLLGFAAFQASARTHSSGVREPLERLGIQPPTSIAPGGSGLLVLLGANGSQPMPGTRVPEFLTRSRLAVLSESTGHIVSEGGFAEPRGSRPPRSGARPSRRAHGTSSCPCLASRRRATHSRRFGITSASSSSWPMTPERSRSSNTWLLSRVPNVDTPAPLPWTCRGSGTSSWDSATWDRERRFPRITCNRC